jgi:ABC-2 type transport system permease protein
MDLVYGLLAELGWALAFIVVARVLYKTGLKRYSAYGG